MEIELPEKLEAEILAIPEYQRFVAEALTRAVESQKKSKGKWKQANNQEVRAALQELKEMGAFSDIDDPVEWQIKVRKDRDLHYR